jgi:hypothetical protein
MKKITPLLTFVIVLLFVACKSDQQKLSGLWFFTHATGNEKEIDKSLNPAGFLDLEPDGKYTRYFSALDYGEWTVNNRDIVLKSVHHTTTTLAIQLLDGNSLMVKIDGSEPNYNFDGYKDRFTNVSDNPFSIDNNQWRIKPTHNETDQQISARLKSHFLFWEKYFSWALNTGKQYVDVRSTPTPIKIYGNGVTLKPFEDLPAGWRNCFYDTADCYKSQVQLQRFFSTADIAWPHTDNKYKMFIGAFQQMEQQMK